MNKKLIMLGFAILIASIFFKLVFIGIKNIKVDKFKPAAVIFVIDSSASNQKSLPEQQKYLVQLCKILDPEDQIKIIKVSEDAYLIYEGSPANISEINNSMKDFTKYNPIEHGTAYGTALNKALIHSLTMKKNGYTPAIVVLGDLEDEGNPQTQIHWNTLVRNVAYVKTKAPDFSMMFLFAYPSKLDFVKGKLNPILGENHLIIAPTPSVDKSTRKFLHAINR